jgi:class 3 adenylate cyclase
VITCATCGPESSATFRFCPACGTALAGTPGPTEARKVVTVIFSDLTGSTALGEALDPETVRTIMARYFSVLRQALERHGGTVEKFIGDAVMAVFGIPHAASLVRSYLSDGVQQLTPTVATDALHEHVVTDRPVVLVCRPHAPHGQTITAGYARSRRAGQPGI